MRFFRIVLFSILLVGSNNTFATGPSYVEAIIKPIAKNSKGDILCKTSFVINPTGGHYLDNIKYGLCILTNDTIIQYSVFLLDGHKTEEEGAYDKYIADQEEWSNWLNDSSQVKQTSEEKQLIKKHRFVINDLKKYQCSDTLSILDFQKSRKIDLQKTKMKSLESGKSRTDFDLPGTILVTYDFGNIVLTQNIIEEYKEIGLFFDYKNLWVSWDGYEINNVTGVLFLDKTKK